LLFVHPDKEPASAVPSPSESRDRYKRKLMTDTRKEWRAVGKSWGNAHLRRDWKGEGKGSWTNLGAG